MTTFAEPGIVGSVANESRTPSRTHGTPAFDQPIYNDWSWFVAYEQRGLIVKMVGKGLVLPNPQELAVIIPKHLIPKRAAIRELIEAAEALTEWTPNCRLIEALKAARKHFE